MSSPQTTHSPQGSPTSPPVIEVFEPAMCCNTGVCGPDPSQALISFTADCAYLASRGVQIVRHNLANDPQAFVDNSVVTEFLGVAGSAGLPLVLVNGVTVAAGAYPDRPQLERLAHLDNDDQGHEDLGLEQRSSGSCCGGDSCCPTTR